MKPKHVTSGTLPKASEKVETTPKAVVTWMDTGNLEAIGKKLIETEVENTLDGEKSFTRTAEKAEECGAADERIREENEAIRTRTEDFKKTILKMGPYGSILV